MELETNVKRISDIPLHLQSGTHQPGDDRHRWDEICNKLMKKINEQRHTAGYPLYSFVEFRSIIGRYLKNQRTLEDMRILKLHQLYAACKDYEDRGGIFSKVFWRRVKDKPFPVQASIF